MARNRRRNPRVDRRGTYRGNFFRVAINAAEVDKFAQSWPGSRLSGRGGFAAEFNSDTGDLVDLEGWPSEFGGRRAADYDEAAMSALLDDMKALGMKKSNRTKNPGRGKLVAGSGSHRERYWRTIAEETRKELRALAGVPGAREERRILQEYLADVMEHVRGESKVLEGRGIGQRRYYSGGRYEHRKKNPKRRGARRRKNFASGMRYIRYLPAGNRIMNPGREFAVSAAYDKRSEATAFLAKLRREGRVSGLTGLTVKPVAGLFSGKRRYVVVGKLKGDRRTNNPKRRRRGLL